MSDLLTEKIWWIGVLCPKVRSNGVSDLNRVGPKQEIETMNNVQQIDAADNDRPTQLHWMEDFDDLTVDDLRELPNHMQLGLDLSVFD